MCVCMDAEAGYDLPQMLCHSSDIGPFKKNAGWSVNSRSLTISASSVLGAQAYYTQKSNSHSVTSIH